MKRRFSIDDESVPSNGINNLVDTFIAETRGGYCSGGEKEARPFSFENFIPCCYYLLLKPIESIHKAF